MTILYSRPLSTAICVAIFLVLGVPTAFSQRSKDTIVEGVSFESVMIGKTTMDEVKALYGKNFETFENGNYSVLITYRALGLTFYACMQDPKKEIFNITFQAPAKARTSKGIVLGKSKLADIFRIYGGAGERTFSDSDQMGVFFFVEEDKIGDGAYETLSPDADTNERQKYNAKIIKRIELIENDGLRQCDSMFGSEDN